MRPRCCHQTCRACLVRTKVAATLPEGANDQLVRTVTENSRTLGFETFEFEKE